MTEETIFTTALKQTDPVQRQVYLDDACAGNPALRQEIETLLKAHEKHNDFLARPAAEQLATGAFPATAPTQALFPAAPAENVEQTQAEQPRTDENELTFLSPSQKPGSLGRLAHYEVLEVLGQGGFGIVVKAFDDKLHRVVAIKIMSLQMAATSPARKRFLREARASAAIRQENVVAIYAVEEQPIPHLVMEYIAGQTLQQKLDLTGPLDVLAVLRLGQQMAAGLAAAHAQGLIHRDIKPSNILLEEGVELRVKITDFGLARAADDASLTQSGVIAGTPMYMSPEQANGEVIDQRADLFSLGSVLYVMCSGRPPFRATTTLGVLKRVTEDTPRPIREIIPEVPEWLCALITQLHAKKPEDRFQTAAAVVDALGERRAALQFHGPVIGQDAIRPLASQRPADLRPGQDAAASRVTLRSSRRRVATLLALVPIMALVAFGIWWFGHTPKPPSDPPDSNLGGDKDGWVQLFNGKDLTGWKQQDWKKPWQVVDNILIGKVDENETRILSTTRGDYENFHLRAEVLAQDLGSDGICFRAEPLQYRGYVAAVSADEAGITGSLLLVHDGDVKWLRTVNSPPHRAADWIVLEIIAQGKEITTRVDGQESAHITDATLARGHVSLAVQGNRHGDGVGLKGGSVIRFRKIEIKELPPSKTGAATAPFLVLAKDAKTERKFATLAEAVTAAQSGDTIEIRGNGPFQTAPMVLDKALTLRAGAGFRPVLVHTKDGWLLQANAPLVLEGLEVHSFGNKTGRDGPWLIGGWNKKSPLRIAHCRFLVKGELHPIGCNSPLLEVLHSEIVATSWDAIVWGPSTKARAIIKNCLVGGRGFAVDYVSSTQDAEVELTGNTIVSLACCKYRFFVAPVETDPKMEVRLVRFKATGNVFQSRFPFEQVEYWDKDRPFRPDALANWSRDHISWEARDNLFAIGGDFLSILNFSGEYKEHCACKALKDWQTYWKVENANGKEGMPLFAGGDLLPKLNKDPLTVAPTDFRQEKGSPGEGFGADVDRVGPGEPYEKWKQTPEYQEWCKKTDELTPKAVDDAWLKEVAALPAEKQVVAVAAKLQNLNPGFDGQETHKIKDGVVTEFRFLTDKVTDISPIQIFNGLRVLDCRGTPNPEDWRMGHGQLTDLTPLKGMNLAGLLELYLPDTQVADAGLAHFKECKNLKFLNLADTKVSNTGLAHFKDCNNLEWLILDGTQVSDAGLAHFKDCNNLTILALAGTKVSNAGLAHFKDCNNLEYLYLNWTKVGDAGLAYFKDCKTLTHVRLADTKVSDAGLAQFKDCKDLAILDVRNTKVTAAMFEELKKALPACKISWGGVDEAWLKQVATLPAEKQVDAVAAKLKDLNPGFDGLVNRKIEGGVVTELRFVTDKVTDISPIQVFNGLRVLDCSGTLTPDPWVGHGQLADLAPLKGMNLAALVELRLNWTKVGDADLAAFKDCKNLWFLELAGTKVTDVGLAPFKDCKNLEHLGLGGTQVSDAGLAYFKDCKDLKGLGLGNMEVSDAGLVHFKDCKNLVLLYLHYTKVGDAGLANFKNCHDLTHLDLAGTKVSNAGLAHFKDCKNLKEIWLSNTQVSDEGLTPFKDCKELARLDLQKTKVTAAMIAELKKTLPGCKIEWDGVDEAWLKPVAALPAEKQIDAVTAKLKELNPDFDGKVTHKIEDGVVTELRFVTDKVTDISPIQVFNSLRVLDCSGTPTPDWWGNGQLGDLSPLKGMNLAGLVELNLNWTKVSDGGLAPFKDCKNLTYLGLASPQVSDTGLAHFKDCKKLTWLNLPLTQVGDAGLAHFEGCKKLVYLNLDGTRVSNVGLAHLQDSKSLTFLSLANTQVGDAGLANFKDCKNLTHVNLDSTKVDDAGLANFQDCKNLTFLALTNTQVSDAGLTNFKDCENLSELFLNDTQVSDEGLAYFKGCKNLAQLHLAHTQVGDAGLANFKDCKKLTVLWLDGTKVGDAGLAHFKDCENLTVLALAGTNVSNAALASVKDYKNLTCLFCNDTKLSDLSALKDMKLTEVGCANTQVSALSPLKDMKLQRLWCFRTQVTDLSPLKGMPLRELRCDFKPKRDAEILRALKTLETINEKPTKDFWQEVGETP